MRNELREFLETNEIYNHEQIEAVMYVLSILDSRHSRDIHEHMVKEYQSGIDTP